MANSVAPHSLDAFLGLAPQPCSLYSYRQGRSCSEAPLSPQLSGQIGPKRMVSTRVSSPEEFQQGLGPLLTSLSRWWGCKRPGNKPLLWEKPGWSRSPRVLQTGPRRTFQTRMPNSWRRFPAEGRPLSDGLLSLLIQLSPIQTAGGRGPGGSKGTAGGR